MTQSCRRMVKVLALAFVAAVTVSAGHAADWSRFRGPNGSAVSEAKKVPTDWNDTKNLAWKTELPGPGSSSPIIVGELAARFDVVLGITPMEDQKPS